MVMRLVDVNEADGVYEIPQNALLTSKTDPSHVITYASRGLCEIANIPAHELCGSPHNIIRHPDVPRTLFQLMWDTLQAHQEFFAVLVNARRGGGKYWSWTHIVPQKSPGTKQIKTYHATHRWVPPKIRQEVGAMYAVITELEHREKNPVSALAIGRHRLQTWLRERDTTYEKWLMQLWDKHGEPE